MANKRDYDVIIIGAGVAGLFCGNYLVRRGRKVLIIEHGSRVGGNIQGIRRKEYFFDCGAQSTESVGILFPLLSDLGLYDPDEWEKAGWRMATRDCDVELKDFAQIREDFKRFFPESAADIDGWFDLIEPGCKVMRDIMGSMDFPLARRRAERLRLLLRMFKTGLPLLPLGRDALTMTGTQKGRETFRDPRLAFLFGEFGNPNMLLFMFFSFWYSFLYDYWHPEGGLQSMADRLVGSFQERGGELVTGQSVDRVFTRGGLATEVETSHGDRYGARIIVNTGNPKRLVRKMCEREAFPYKYREIIKNTPVSDAWCSAYLGVDIPHQELEKYLRSHHTLYWRTYETPEDIYDPELYRKGFSQFSWTSMRDKSLAPEGKNSLVVQTFIPYAWMNGWGTNSADPEVRTDEYRRLKETVLDSIIEESEYIIPGLGERVELKELATPRTLSRFTLNPEGSAIGWTYDMYRTPLYGRFARFGTPIKNLFTAGHYGIWPGGVVFSALSGKMVAEGICEGFTRALLW